MVKEVIKRLNSPSFQVGGACLPLPWVRRGTLPTIITAEWRKLTLYPRRARLREAQRPQRASPCFLLTGSMLPLGTTSSGHNPAQLAIMLRCTCGTDEARVSVC